MNLIPNKGKLTDGPFMSINNGAPSDSSFYGSINHNDLLGDPTPNALKLIPVKGSPGYTPTLQGKNSSLLYMH